MAGKHALVVVHGMGSSKKGSNLRNAAKHLLSAIDRRRDPDARLDVSSSSMDADIPYVDIRHRDDIYHIEEYWWAESFSPASAPAISWWIATRATRHLWHFAAKSAGNLKAFGLRTVSALPFVDFNATSRIDNITSLNRQAATEARAARGLDRSKPRNTLAGLYICVLLTLGIPVAVLGPLLLLVMKYLAFIPFIKSLADLIKSALEQIVIGSMGDIFVAMTDDVQATSLRDGLIDQLIRLGNDDTVDNIVILAHSTGNLIAYDALATLQELSSSTPPDGASNSLTRQHNERIGNVLSVLAKTSSFVSIGSILTMAWSTGVTRASNNRYLRPIPEGIHWWNIWTRFDIATGSPLQLPEEHEHLPDPMNYHASNFGSLAFDHTAYWQNQEDVHFLLLEELGGRDSTNYFWRGRQSRQTRDPGSSEPRPVPAPSRFEQGDSDGRFENLKWVGRVLIAAHVIGLVMIILFLLFPGFARGSGEFLQIDHASSVVQFEWGSDVLQKDAKLNSIEELARSFFVGIVIWAIAALIWFVTMKLIYWHISMNGLHFRVTVRFFRWIRIDVDGWRSHRAAAFRETKRRSVVPE